MYKNFNLTESEREDILNQHSSYGYKQPLNEQSNNQMITKYGNQGYPLTKKALDQYGLKLASIIKGKTAQIPILGESGGLLLADILGYNGRQHIYDNIENIAQIPSCSFIFNIKVNNSSSPKYPVGQKGLIFLDVKFNNLKFVGLNEISVSFGNQHGITVANPSPQKTTTILGTSISQLNLQPVG